MEQPFDTWELATLHRLVSKEIQFQLLDPESEKANPGELAHLEELKVKLRDILIPPEIEQYEAEDWSKEMEKERRIKEARDAFDEDNWSIEQEMELEAKLEEIIDEYDDDDYD